MHGTAGEGCAKPSRRGGWGLRGWPRARPPARPARRGRPAPSAPEGALTPILLRKHLLSFKVTRPPFRHGDNKPQPHHSALQAGRGKSTPQKRPFPERNTAAGEALPARTLRPSLPPLCAEGRGSPRHRGPQRLFSARLRNSLTHPAAYPQRLLILITPIITIATTAIGTIIIIAIVISRIRGSKGQVTKRGGRTGEPAPCRCAGRCADAENRRPARGEPSAYRFAALPACGGAREGRCNPFCARVAIRVPEEIAAAGATSGGEGAGGWRQRARGSAHPSASAGEEAARGRGSVSAAAAGPAAGFGERDTNMRATAIHLSLDKG